MKIGIYQPLSIHEVGKRSNQEDCIFPAVGKASDQDCLFVLCDGMGGHEHGEVASQIVCQALSFFFSQYAFEYESLTDTLLLKALSYAYGELDKQVRLGDTHQMGTTLVMLCFHKQGCTVAHIGDSRIYHLRPSSRKILYKSRDHSLAYDLYQAGEISYEEIKTFPQKNVITRAMIAGDKKHPKADFVHVIDIQPGDYFYLCSDGMLEQMEDEELLKIFSLENSDEEKQTFLLNSTKENRDNHSAYIIHIKEVIFEESDALLINEEPTAKCNAINIKPDVVAISSIDSSDVQIVKPPIIVAPPPLPKNRVLQFKGRQKKMKSWIFFLSALVIVLFVGFGFGHFFQHKGTYMKDVSTPLKREVKAKKKHKRTQKLKNKKKVVNKETATGDSVYKVENIKK